MDFEFFGTPNAGNTKLTSIWCTTDFDKTGPSKGIKNFYLTKAYIQRLTSSRWKTDVIGSSVININSGDLGGNYAETYKRLYPRGIARPTADDGYITGHCNSLNDRRILLQVAYNPDLLTALFMTIGKVPALGIRMLIHSTSYYLSGLQEVDYSYLNALRSLQQ